MWIGCHPATFTSPVATFCEEPPLSWHGRVLWRRPCPPLSDATLPARLYARSQGNLGAGFLFSGGSHQVADREQPLGIGPGVGDREAAAPRHRRDAGEVVLVGILGVHA